ncbi:mannose-6-phosphate isomerase [Flavobacterium paronense]|uniref:Phosphohexomutase n=1 Tax=Flavobacterium paronense TaxID=1392775 RepID=A0ABV5GAW8_9FLAO|nr:type I phosphomannose isomerase catalytic subunit [Flavobacterium paronense]MDN3675805.1 mannose-6-phosphate isomerase [Flavobacterium paronense]MDN3675820.1 mannose-6-phosphate isomerase [Flavobacterium paronense]MDN3676763.1 mannose-6-phosphate isomerase [Flavobacterium paronense]
MKLYPLQFEPILKERIWGGTKLKTYLNKPITSDITGESWEIATVENDISIIANGTLKGKSLNELINEFPVSVLGTKVYAQFGKQFPLLFKYLDAREDLSIQVHPNDELAKKRHNSFGKTEMWYVIQADSDARLIVGFKEKSSPEEFIENLNNKTLLSILDTKKVKQGDVFILNTGTIHAIGAGIIIAEIQQTSDITYRVYDFDRKEANGNTRELHVNLALEALNYEKIEAQRFYSKTENTSNEIINCNYFTTNFIPLDGATEIHKNEKSFTVYMCVEGSFQLTIDGKNYTYQKGNTVLIPAALTDFQLSGKASILEIYIS